jgi:hypothetical protein
VGTQLLWLPYTTDGQLYSKNRAELQGDTRVARHIIRSYKRNCRHDTYEPLGVKTWIAGGLRWFVGHVRPRATYLTLIARKQH